MAICETSLLFVYKLFMVCNSFPIKKCGGRLPCRQAQMHTHLHPYMYMCALLYASTVWMHMCINPQSIELVVLQCCCDAFTHVGI